MLPLRECWQTRRSHRKAICYTWWSLRVLLHERVVACDDELGAAIELATELALANKTITQEANYLHLLSKNCLR